MSRPITASLGAVALCAAVTLAPLGASTAAEGLRCEIRIVSGGGMIGIEPTVLTEDAVRGVYRLRLTGSGPSGRTDVSQGGPFDAGPGATRLARTSLSAGSRAEAVLTVTVGADAVTCSQRITP